MLKSASKVVLIMFSFTSCVAFLAGKLSPELFAAAQAGVFGFFFANKGDSSQQYLGK